MTEMEIVELAFFRMFEGSGEQWFSYFGSMCDRIFDVQDSWEEFLREIESIRRFPEESEAELRRLRQIRDRIDQTPISEGDDWRIRK